MIVTPVNGPEFIASSIEASQLFTDAGIVVFNPEQPEVGTGIIVDDGLPNGLQGVETALSSTGLCIIVGQFDECSVASQTEGAVSHACRFTVLVRENIERNRSPQGTGITCTEAAVEVVRSVISSPTSSPVFRRMASGTLRNLRIENGTWACAVTLTIPTVIK